MQHQNIILAGGTGFIGEAICNYFGQDNTIVILTRNLPGEQRNTKGAMQLQAAVADNIRYVQWDGTTPGEWMKEFNYADVVINMAGKSVNCRYTPKNKQQLFDSRTNSTKAIGLAVQQATHSPKLWINAASATIYPFATDEPRDERFTHFADDFSVQVCKQWEQALFDQRTPFTRKIALRTAIALGQGGVMTPYFNLLKFGLGGRQGNGRQWYSWIHIEDICRMIDWLHEHKELEGVFNASSPNAVSNAEFMATMRQVTQTKIGLPAPEWMLKIGAAIIGTETELILKSRWVLPTKMVQTGFQFKYPILKDAIAEIIAKTPRHRYKLF